MKAAVLIENRKIQYMEIPNPALMPGSVRIKVAACGICGSDVPRVFRNGAHSYPIVLGHEFSGVVSEVSDSGGLEVGDHVVGVPLVPCHQCVDCRKGNYSLCAHYSFVGSRQQGAFADEVVIPAANAVKISKKITFEQAATFEPSTVALHGFFQNHFESGGTVAILGCGIIGLFAVQWAKYLGASKIVAISRGKSGLAAAMELGADAVVSTMDEDYLKQIEELTGGRGFDYVFETSGSDATMHLAFQAAGKKSHVCLIGTPVGELTFTKPMWEQINRKEFWLTGSWMSYSAPFPGKEWSMTAEAFESGKLRIVPGMIYKTFPMSQASEAFSLFEQPGTVKGRVMLVNQL